MGIFARRGRDSIVSYSLFPLPANGGFRALLSWWKDTSNCGISPNSSEWQKAVRQDEKSKHFWQFHRPRHRQRDGCKHSLQAPLVEECEIVRIEAVQRAFGKKALLAAVRQAQSFRLPVVGGHFDVWFVDVPHRLPGRVEQWASREDGTVRLYLWCPGCQRRKTKLRYYFLPGGSGLSELRCQECHDLAYQSVNCGGNRWWREIARPLKRLLREKESLSVKLPSPRYDARIREIDNAIAVLRQKAEPKQRRGCQALFRERRPYRDLSLIGDWMGNQCVARSSGPMSHRSKPVGQRKSLLR